MSLLVVYITAALFRKMSFYEWYWIAVNETFLPGYYWLQALRRPTMKHGGVTCRRATSGMHVLMYCCIADAVRYWATTAERRENTRKKTRNTGPPTSRRAEGKENESSVKQPTAINIYFYSLIYGTYFVQSQSHEDPEYLFLFTDIIERILCNLNGTKIQNIF